MKLSFCQNDSLIGGSFWQKDSLITHILFELCLFRNLAQCTFFSSPYSLVENTPNASEFICPICLPKQQSSGFQSKKASLGVRSPCSNRTFSKFSIIHERLAFQQLRIAQSFNCSSLRYTCILLKAKMVDRFGTTSPKEGVYRYNCDQIRLLPYFLPSFKFQIPN